MSDGQLSPARRFALDAYSLRITSSISFPLDFSSITSTSSPSQSPMGSDMLESSFERLCRSTSYAADEQRDGDMQSDIIGDQEDK